MEFYEFDYAAFNLFSLFINRYLPDTVSVGSKNTPLYPRRAFGEKVAGLANFHWVGLFSTGFL